MNERGEEKGVEGGVGKKEEGLILCEENPDSEEQAK